MRFPFARSNGTATAARLTRIEEDLARLQRMNDVLWALAPQWITACLPHALEEGWTVEATTGSITFRHADRADTYMIRVPLPDLPEQITLQRDLHMRLGYIGITGLEHVEPPSNFRPRIMDLRG